MQLTDVELEALFREWWAQSYRTPLHTYALLTHLGWGRYLLKRLTEAAEAAEQ